MDICTEFLPNQINM